MSKSPSRFDINASRVPSGDHTGLRSLAGLVVRTVCWEPSPAMVMSSKSPSRSELNASRPFAPGKAACPDEVSAADVATAARAASRRRHDQLMGTSLAEHLRRNGEFAQVQ